jgi:hypothetical protein
MVISFGHLCLFFKLAQPNCSNMKKICLILIFLVSINIYSHAQTTPAQTTPTKAKAKKDAAKAAPATVHTKKDGTPDKRYKENK